MPVADRALARLPKWARQEIERLERRVEELERPLHSATPTRVVVDPYIDPRYLPEDERVRFVLPGGWIDVRLEDDVVYLQADPALQVRPRSSNVIEVEAVQL